MAAGTVSGGALTVAVDGAAYIVGDGHLAVDGADWTLVIPAEAALGFGIYDVEAVTTDGLGGVVLSPTELEFSEVWISIKPSEGDFHEEGTQAPLC